MAPGPRRPLSPADRPLRLRAGAEPLRSGLLRLCSGLLGLRSGLLRLRSGLLGLRDALGPYVANARNNAAFPNPVQSSGVMTIGGYTVTNIDLLIIVAAVLMMVALDQFIRRSRLGRGIRAVAQDSEAAALMGVNRDRVVQLSGKPNPTARDFFAFSNRGRLREIPTFIGMTGWWFRRLPSRRRPRGRGRAAPRVPG